MEIPQLDTITTTEQARDLAIDWQHWAGTQSLSLNELNEWAALFETLGRNYGLTAEFRENGLTSASAQEQEIEMILGTVSGTVFRGPAGEVIILLNEDNYAISVDDEGHTVSAYLVTVPPAEIAAAMEADEGEISGWSTGWEA
jgi:hypothetical protein